MREIKFRGKKFYTSEWVYGSLIQWPNEEADILELDSGGSLFKRKVNTLTVGQYTGMKDENEQEIYEGDIVNVSWGKEEIPMQVLMQDGEWVLNEYGDDTYQSLYDFRQKELEVIGNIHDNPELLKGGQDG